MKKIELTEDELKILSDYSDVSLLEIIKGMSLEEMRLFDVYCPTDLKHFNQLQRDWISTEKYLVSCKNHSEADIDDLLLDFNSNHLGERFHVFYSLKFPNKISSAGSLDYMKDKLTEIIESFDIPSPLVKILRNLL